MLNVGIELRLNTHDGARTVISDSETFIVTQEAGSGRYVIDLFDLRANESDLCLVEIALLISTKQVERQRTHHLWWRWGPSGDVGVITSSTRHDQRVDIDCLTNKIVISVCTSKKRTDPKRKENSHTWKWWHTLIPTKIVDVLAERVA